ncbi:MAG: penicillin acylase family protein, partial [Myxococcota bacterium]
MTRWLVLAAGLLACGGGADEGEYTVDIRTTEFGIPHIMADDYFSAGVGVGYSLARDHLCILGDQFVKVNSERSRYYGPGDDDENLTSDFGWLGTGIRERAEDNFDSLDQPTRDMMSGYAEGYNRYLADTPEGDLDPRCAGADWLEPIDAIDLFTYYNSLALEGSGRNLLGFVATAQPPGFRNGQPPFPIPPREAFDDLREPALASNGWGIGSERSESGRGMLLANPHFPSDGPLKLWEHHITIPGELNVYGVGLLHAIVPLIGFNDAVAWTHTVSPTPRFVIYKLDLDPADPTRYQVDGEFLDMESTQYSIEVLRDGELQTELRTLFRTIYGPMLNPPVAGWGGTVGYTYRDANEDNVNVIRTFLGAGRSQSLEEFEQNY